MPLPDSHRLMQLKATRWGFFFLFAHEQQLMPSAVPLQLHTHLKSVLLRVFPSKPDNVSALCYYLSTSKYFKNQTLEPFFFFLKKRPFPSVRIFFFSLIKYYYLYDKIRHTVWEHVSSTFYYILTFHRRLGVLPACTDRASSQLEKKVGSGKVVIDFAHYTLSKITGMERVKNLYFLLFWKCSTPYLEEKNTHSQLLLYTADHELLWNIKK